MTASWDSSYVNTEYDLLFFCVWEVVTRKHKKYVSGHRKPKEQFIRQYALRLGNYCYYYHNYYLPLKTKTVIRDAIYSCYYGLGYSINWGKLCEPCQCLN